MNTHRHSDSGLTLVEAVETLSNIADLEIDRQIGVTQKHDLIIQDEKVSYRTVHWLHKKDADSTISLVRETFRVILNYLRHFYEKDYTYVTDQPTLDRVKTIMVLVGEAAKKLDKYTELFQKTQIKSITECREYKELQDFYLRKISRTIDEGVLGKWILALSKKALAAKVAPQPIVKKNTETSRVFVDLESVKKDTEYELFYIRKEDGSRFFSPRLIRNIKLVCDFGQYFGKGKEREADPLEDLHITEDRSFLGIAQSIMKKARPVVNDFYQDTFQYKENPLVALVNSSVMALMLSGSSIHLYNGTAKKNCKDYFNDFLTYLRESLHSRECQKLIAYPPKSSDKAQYTLLKTLETLCLHLFMNLRDGFVIRHYVNSLIEAANEGQSPEHLQAYHEKPTLTNRLSLDHAALVRLLKKHPNGPLSNVLDNLESGIHQVWDNLQLMNIPQHLYNLSSDKQQISVSRIPAPIHQEFIHKAEVNDEFKMFLRAYADKNVGGKHLMLNFQDCSSWREFARCKAIEELQDVSDFNKVFTCITLAVDTEFYHQLAPYHDENHMNVFKQQLKDQVSEDGCGFYFPESIKKKIVSFIPHAIDGIHKVFFSNKNVLSRERRMDFIEIFYIFLVLKLIDLTKPTSMSFTCKDGIDTSEMASSELLCFLNSLHEEGWSNEELQALNGIIYGPALIYRQRAVLPERFDRTVSALKMIEGVKDEIGMKEFAKTIDATFSKLYDSPVFNMNPVLPTNS